MESNSNININLELYLSGRMSAKEKVAFEEEIKSFPKIKAFLDLYYEIDKAGSDEDWPIHNSSKEIFTEKQKLFEKPDTQIFAENIKNFRKSNPSKPLLFKKSNLFYWLGTTAAVLMLLWALYPKELTINELYLQNKNWDDLTSLTIKGDKNEQVYLALESNFRSKEYKKVIMESQKILDTISTPQVPLLLYIGISELEVNNYSQAIATFDKIIQSNTIDFHKGYWYKALLYLKKGDKVTCMEILNIINSNPTYFKYKEAKILLKNLENEK